MTDDRLKEIATALRTRGRYAQDQKHAAIEQGDTGAAILYSGMERAFVEAIILVTGEWDIVDGVFVVEPTLTGDFVRLDGTHGETYVLGRCSHGVDLDAAICPHGCRV